MLVPTDGKGKESELVHLKTTFAADFSDPVAGPLTINSTF